MSGERPASYLVSLVNELRALPRETEWLEFKTNDSQPQAVGEYISALANAVKLAPNDARIPQFRALAAWREQKPEIAVKHAEEAIAKGDDLYELRMGLADYYAGPGKNEEKAKEHWRRAVGSSEAGCGCRVTSSGLASGGSSLELGGPSPTGCSTGIVAPSLIGLVTAFELAPLPRSCSACAVRNT